MQKDPFELNCGLNLASLHTSPLFREIIGNEIRKETCTKKEEKQDCLSGDEKIHK